MDYVIYFDGECAFCSRSVRFVQQRDKRSLFTFEVNVHVLDRLPAGGAPPSKAFSSSSRAQGPWTRQIPPALAEPRGADELSPPPEHLPFEPNGAGDTLILRRSDGREWRYGKGALRILWLLGGWWRIPGLLSFLPAWLVDGPYRWIAKRRHLLG